MKQNIQQFCHDGASCTEKMIRINEQISLRVLCFTPIKKWTYPIVMIGGLITAIENFKDVFRELSKDFTIYYINTREKISAEINGEVEFDIETMGKDVVSVIQQLGLNDAKYALIGYSMGATIASDCYRFLQSKPAHLVLIEPTPVFHYPRWSIKLVSWFGVTFYCILKPFGKWYLQNRIIDKNEDNEMANITTRSLKQAHPYRLRKTILQIANYTVWNRLDSISCPVLIIGTSKDRMHIHNEIIRMVTALKNCSYIDLETNKRTHSPEMAQVITNYLSLKN